MSKIFLLHNMLNFSLVQFGIFYKLLNVDESMVPYFGCNSAKTFIRGKPIRFVYKIWCLCESDGYSYPMQIYKGKQSNAINQLLGTRAINNKVSHISSNSNVLYRQLYFDNFLTSDHLIIKLAEKSMRAIGTIRQNRTEGTNKQLVQSKELRKKERGTYDFCNHGKVYIAKWHDNSVVNIANNRENYEPVRNSKAEDKRRS